MLSTYEGEKPYVFVSYSHKDSDEVLTVIAALQEKGYRVWFDAGIAAGSEWPEYIAKHLRGSACVMAFISDSFALSRNCRRELTFAQEMNLPMLNVYLKNNVQLSDGLRMQLGLNQCVYKPNFKKMDDFVSALCRAEYLAPCVFEDGEEGNMPVHAKTHPQASTIATTVSDTPVYRHPRRRAVLSWTVGLLEFSYAVIGPAVMNFATDEIDSIPLLILTMFLPQFLLTTVCITLLALNKSRLDKDEHKSVVDTMDIVIFLAAIISLIAGAFYVNTTESVFLRILISIGLHIPPLFGSYIISPTDKEGDKK